MIAGCNTAFKERPKTPVLTFLRRLEIKMNLRWPSGKCAGPGGGGRTMSARRFPRMSGEMRIHGITVFLPDRRVPETLPSQHSGSRHAAASQDGVRSRSPGIGSDEVEDGGGEHVLKAGPVQAGVAPVAQAAAA